MTEYREILYEVDEQIATITFNRPEHRNPISADLLTEVTSAVRAAQHDDAVRVLVLTGAGRAFCSGGDVKSMAQVASAGGRALSARPEQAGRGSASRDTGIRPALRAVRAARRGGGQARGAARPRDVVRRRARLHPPAARRAAPDGGSSGRPARAPGAAAAEVPGALSRGPQQAGRPRGPRRCRAPARRPRSPGRLDARAGRTRPRARKVTSPQPTGGTPMAGTTQEVLQHHLDCFGKRDVDGGMADYSAASNLC